jgi:hypothetical protein
MGRLSVGTRDELVEATGRRYAEADRHERGRILDELTSLTGLHRKHVARLLRGGGAGKRDEARPERRIYDDAMRESLIVIWEASDRVCGKRLRPLMPMLVEAMERHGHLQLAAEVRSGLLSMSAATIDRALRDVRGRSGGRARRHAAPAAAVRRSVAVRTFEGWDDPPPGFMEADLVAHSGPTARGSFVQTLTVTDIATGWTECAPVLVREQSLLTAVLGEIRKLLPFPLLGLDTDNDSVFLNETVRDYCQAAGITFTRCRPYRKNDQAWVEQKNGAVVRRSVGYRRFEGLEAAAALARLYRSLRLFVNYFQPSFKLAGKAREGARVRKRYHAPATPYQRLLADPRTPDPVRQEMEAVYVTLDPVQLLSDIRQVQARLVEIADQPVTEATPAAGAPTLEQFLASLRTAWQQGEVRPTSRAKEKAKRGRRRPDPFVAVTAEVRGWFDAEPWRTSRELFERLQAAQPGKFPDGQLRTLQRRIKDWRRQKSHAMVFGAIAGSQPMPAEEATLAIHGSGPC